MNTQSPRGHLDEQDYQKILTIFIHGLIGITITLISEVFLKWNYGAYTPLVTTGLSLVSLVLTQLFNGPSASTIKIQQLETIITNLQNNQAAQNEIAKNT